MGIRYEDPAGIKKIRIFVPLVSPENIPTMADLMEITLMGEDLFGHMDRFNIWLNESNPMLDHQKPADLLKDDHGRELVLAELTRINYGILV